MQRIALANVPECGFRETHLREVDGSSVTRSSGFSLAIYGHKLTWTMMATAAVLSLNDLRRLDEWLHGRIAEADAGEEIPGAASHAVVEQCKTPVGTYRLERVKCGKPACKVCKDGPAHGPYWYRYWKQKGRTRLEYIGKELKQRKVKT